MELYFRRLDGVFSIGPSDSGKELLFLGCTIYIKDEGSVEMTMDDYLRRIEPFSLSEERKYHTHSMKDDREKSEYRSLGGTLLYLVQCAITQACIVDLKIKKRVGRYTIKKASSKRMRWGST